MMNKEERIKKVLHLAAGKPYQVIKARPANDFRQIKSGEDMYHSDQSGEDLGLKEINDRYQGNGDQISKVEVIRALVKGEVIEPECSRVIVLPISKDQIII